MFSTEIKARKKGKQKKISSRRIKLSSFFKYLEGNEWDKLYETDDVYAHLILNHVFEEEIDFNNIQTGQVTKGTCKEFYEGIKNDDFLGIVVKPWQLKILKDAMKENRAIVDFGDYLEKMMVLRDFSLSSVENVWELQGSVEAVVRGILKARRKERPTDGNFSSIRPLDGVDISIPKLNYMIGGVNFPVAIQEAPKNLHIEKVSNRNNDKGIAIVDNDGVIYDIIKINEFWLSDYPLSTRIKFLGRFENFKPYLICETINEVLDAAEVLKVDKQKGVLMRSVLEIAVPSKTNWLIWSPKSRVTFKVWRERRNSPKYLRLLDDFVHEFDIDLDGVDYNFMEVSLDGKSHSLGFEPNWVMDRWDFDVWSRILRMRRPGRRKERRVGDF